LVLRSVAWACGIDTEAGPSLRAAECIETVQTDAPPGWVELVAGRVRRVLGKGGAGEPGCSPGGAASNSASGDGAVPVVFPGAFQPRHDGHRTMAQLASQILGQPVAHEISIENVDKPPLDFTSMRRRADQFNDDQRLWLTRAATFAEKAELFPGATFIVGADTISRIADSKYYGGDPQVRDAAVRSIVDHGCRFLVFGRRRGETFETLGDMELPEPLRSACQAVSESAFRSDVSSTELRRRNQRSDIS
jgi:nicotinic acid mononucleotide adenylyltransferase